MKIEIILYGMTKEMFSTNTVWLDFPHPATISEIKHALLQHLKSNYDSEKAKQLIAISAVATSEEIISPNLTIDKDMQLSLLPPVSGG